MPEQGRLVCIQVLILGLSLSCDSKCQGPSLQWGMVLSWIKFDKQE
jgi:hypothetical protein